MRTLPTTMIRVLAPFAPLFSKCVFQHVQLLLTGSILAPGKRTVTSALGAMGLDKEKRYCRYHRVLSRVACSTREASRILLGLLVEAFVPDGPLVVGVDETLERRQGKKIAAKGIYRDPLRSSHTHFVKTSALRWVCLTLLAPIPWASRVLGFAVPFGAGPFRTLHERTRKATQEAYRVGLAIAFAGEALAARTRVGSRRRWRICVFGTPRSLPRLEKADHLHHSLTSGCRPLRTGPTTVSRPDGTAPAQG